MPVAYFPNLGDSHVPSGTFPKKRNPFVKIRLPFLPCKAPQNSLDPDLTQTGNFTEKCQVITSKAEGLSLRNMRIYDSMLVSSSQNLNFEEINRMGTGIQICGLNGCGKSTLGRALAERVGFYFIDNEDLYFSRTNADESYMNPKSRTDVERLLMEEVRKHPDFVFAAVKGDYGTEIISMYNYVVVLEVPKEIRSQRVRNRSFQKFGDRMLIGGDLHNQEETFFQMVDSRQDDYIEKWLQRVRCPIIRVDGSKPIEDNVEYIIQAIGR